MLREDGLLLNVQNPTLPLLQFVIHNDTSELSEGSTALSLGIHGQTLILSRSPGAGIQNGGERRQT